MTNPFRRRGFSALALTLTSLTACVTQTSKRTTTVDFEVSEGTNLAFDISPDGETIAFDLLGQLWLMPAEGGRARPLTDAVRDTAEDVDPAFSPDGQRIVFQSDRPGGKGLWLVPREGGEPRHITPGINIEPWAGLAPAWSPVGNEVAYALRDTLYRQDIATGATARIPIDSPSGNALRGVGALAWSPDGERIAFGTAGGLKFRFGVGANARVWEVAAAGGTATPVTAEGVRAVAPTYSPDGTRIAYFAPDSVDRWQLWVHPIAGGPAVQLTDHADMVIRTARWTPDNTSIIYSAEGRLWRVSPDRGAPVEIPFTARVQFEREQVVLPPVRFAEPGTEQPARGFNGLALSPDGTRIAMLALGKLWAWPVDGSPRAVTNVPAGAHHLSWSGDGTEVVFTTGDLFTTNVQTGTTRQLTALPGAEEYPTWSPDGRHVAFMHGRECRPPGVCIPGPIRLILAADGVAEELSETTELAAPLEGWQDVQIAWRPDSRAMLVYSSTTTALLGSVEGEARSLERIPTAATFLHWPTTDAVVYAHGNRLWRAAFDNDSGMIGEPTPISDEPALYVSAAANGAILYVSHDGLRLRGRDGQVATIGWPVTYEVPPASPPLLIRNARVIDGTSAPPAQPRDILVENGRIARIAPTGTLEGVQAAEMIDAAGRTVIPGLIDLHRHLIGEYRDAIRQVAGALYHGVTTVRDAGSLMAQTAALRDAVDSGRWPGTRVILGGYVFVPSGEGLGDGGIQLVDDDAQIARAVAIARAFGADYVKHLGYSDWAPLVTTISEAHRRGMRVSGHCASVLPAVAAGIDGQEHAGSCYRDEGGIYNDYAQMRTEAGTWVVTTTGVWLSFLQVFDDPTIRDRPDIAPFLGDFLRLAYDPQFSVVLGPIAQRRYRIDRAQTARYHESGVLIATGSDNYLPTALHIELEGLVEGGLSPLEAITAGTSTAARVLGAEAEIGTIEVGKLADLVILDADPLADIRNTQQIWRVIRGGRVVDRAALLERIRALPTTSQ
jgi:Tol biopolymer transport system component